MNKYLTRRNMWLMTLVLCFVIVVSACGKNAVGTASNPPHSNNVPLGTGTTPEPGTDGKPVPLPDGHYESMVASNGIDFVGSDNGVLYALNGQNGTVRWQYNAGTSVYVAAVSNGIVYAQADGDSNGVAYAFNANTGRLLWQYRVNDTISGQLADNGIVYIGTAATGNRATLYALQASSGALLWSYSAQVETPGLLTAADGAVFYAEISGIGGENFHERITALRSSDGAALWRLPVDAADGYAHGTPAISNGIVYIGTNNGAVYAVRIADGKLVWHVSRAGGFKAIPLDIAPLVDNGMVFIEGKQGANGESQSLFAMRASDGELLWSRPEGNAPGPMVEQPQVANGVIYAVDGAGDLAALRETDGVVLWKHTGDPVYGPFIVADGLVQVNGADGVFALRASDGALSWKQGIDFHSSLSSAGPPEVVDAGIVYVATTNGTVQALQASNGKQLWRYVIQERAVQTNPIYSALAQFSDSVTYQQAIRLVTDLGLQTFAECAFSWKLAGDSDVFATDHLLTVAATVNTAPLWFNRLQALPGVIRLEAEGIHSCPMQPYSPHAPKYMGPDTPSTFVQVTFSNATSYDTALDGVNNLGFRLANRSYEQARARGDAPAWSSAGQESSFAKTRILFISITGYNSTTWAQQLKSLAGVIKVVTA